MRFPPVSDDATPDQLEIETLPKNDQILSIAEPADDADLLPEVAEVLAYWHKVRGPAFAPRWGDYRLVDISSALLPWSIVVDLEHMAGKAAPNMKYRYWGTEWTQLYKCEMSGKDVSEFPPHLLSKSLMAQYTQIIERRIPLSFSNTYPMPSGLTANFATLRVPLSDDGHSVTKIASVTKFLENREALERTYEMQHPKP